MDLGLKDKVAIVTGSSRGLGLASARALASRKGAVVCLCAPQRIDRSSRLRRDVADARGR